MADTRKLPNPVAERWDWQLRGACRDMDSAVFFHPESERGPARAARITRAKQVCSTCPVLEQCRLHAMTVEEPYGVWGGLPESERNDMRHDRGDIMDGLDVVHRILPAVARTANLRLA